MHQNTTAKIPIVCGFINNDTDPLIEIYKLASEMGYPDNIIKCIPFIKTQVKKKYKFK